MRHRLRGLGLADDALCLSEAETGACAQFTTNATTACAQVTSKCFVAQGATEEQEFAAISGVFCE